MTLITQLEAILFVAAKPVAPAELAKATGVALEAVMSALAELEAKYAESGLRLIRHAEKVSLGTAPDVAETVKKFLRAEDHGELTRPALETLSVISYRGPVTKPEIEQIRGVNCTLVIRNLLMRGLVEEAQNAHGEPTYQVTHAFLGHLGLTKIETLPEYEMLRHHPDLEKAIAELAQATEEKK